MGLSACDMGKRVQPRGESLTIIASDPEAAEGLDCQLDSGSSCGLPVGGPLRFKFDRWLLPTTATRQSLAMYTAGTGLGVMLRPSYDVASRTIAYAFELPMPAGAGRVFNLRLADADQDPNGYGFRGFDGVPLDSSVTIAFRTALEWSSSAPAEGLASGPPSCADVVRTFARAGCNRLGCHSREASSNCAGTSVGMAWDESLQQCVNVPRMGLLLDDAQGLLATAIDHVAHETQNGTDTSLRFESGGRFGDQMPIIDKGRPENSYLIYKLLVGKAFNRELHDRADSADSMSAEPMTEEQISHARDWFIRFGPMPPDEVGAPDGVSMFDTYTTLAAWIRAGASCP